MAKDRKVRFDLHDVEAMPFSPPSAAEQLPKDITPVASTGPVSLNDIVAEAFGFYRAGQPAVCRLPMRAKAGKSEGKGKGKVGKGKGKGKGGGKRRAKLFESSQEEAADVVSWLDVILVKRVVDPASVEELRQAKEALKQQQPKATRTVLLQNQRTVNLKRAKAKKEAAAKAGKASKARAASIRPKDMAGRRWFNPKGAGNAGITLLLMTWTSCADHGMAETCPELPIKQQLSASARGFTSACCPAGSLGHAEH